MIHDSQEKRLAWNSGKMAILESRSDKSMIGGLFHFARQDSKSIMARFLNHENFLNP